MNQHTSVIRELLESGLTQQQLGVLIGKSQAWVGAVLAGKFADLKWKDGEALRRLHKERMIGARAGPDTDPESKEREAA